MEELKMFNIPPAADSVSKIYDLNRHSIRRFKGTCPYSTVVFLH
jgi:hypothetical protein